MEFENLLGTVFPGEIIANKDRTLSKFTQAKIRLAAHPKTKGAVLAKLARDDCHHVLIRVSENANTPWTILEELADHDNIDVRIAVSENANTPFAALLRLACGESLDVRYSMAENHNTPPAILVILGHDDNPYVACRALDTMRRITAGRTVTKVRTVLGEKQKRWRRHSF